MREYLQVPNAPSCIPLSATKMLPRLTSYRISKGMSGNIESFPAPRRPSGCFSFSFGVAALNTPTGPTSLTSGPWSSSLPQEGRFPRTLVLRCAETMMVREVVHKSQRLTPLLSADQSRRVDSFATTTELACVDRREHGRNVRLGQNPGQDAKLEVLGTPSTTELE